MDSLYLIDGSKSMLTKSFWRARLGTAFPVSGVGKNWTLRFVEKHSAHIKMSWASSLESKRGQAVNPHTIEAWYDLYKTTVEEYDIAQECTWGTDEVGCNPADREREWVMGARQQGLQYQQRNGVRENITVIETICADGTTVPPAVIFKGKGYQVKWKQDNPANASIGYSVKGWTNGAIGVEWIKQFDQITTRKAAGWYRLLIVNGHNSHYTRRFLEYAWAHLIIVLCYPSHTTHVLQGLDIVVFAVLKHCLSSKEHDRWEREMGEQISKQNFLTIYGCAHLRAMTPDTIISAFRKTGLWPFNPGVIAEDMMAPSKETSCEGSLPIIPATPVHIVAKLLQDLIVLDDIQSTEDSRNEGADSEDDSPAQEQQEGDNDHTDHEHVESQEHVESDDELCEDFQALSLDRRTALINDVLRTLSDGSLATLVSSDPLPAAATSVEHHTSYPISPNRNMGDVMASRPRTATKAYLLAALQESQVRKNTLKERAVHLQAANILNEACCNKLRKQLAHYEGKKTESGSRGKLMGDGLLCLLLADAFTQRVVEHEAWQEREAREKEARKQTKADHSNTLLEWRQQEEECKAENTARKQQWEEEKQRWEQQKAAAKASKTKLTVKKPTLGKLRGPIPKPVVAHRAPADSSDEEESNDDMCPGSD